MNSNECDAKVLSNIWQSANAWATRLPSEWYSNRSLQGSKHMNYYETDRIISEYLVFHYGKRSEILPFAERPIASLNFPKRCADLLLEYAPAEPAAVSALDIGCAVGRSSFELTRRCHTVVGIDYSRRFIDAAEAIRRDGSVTCKLVEEGDICRSMTGVLPEGLSAENVRFQHGDACELPDTLGAFDLVLLANLIDRLREPHRCVQSLHAVVKPGGHTLITSPYTWSEAFTPKCNWLGGFERDGRPVRTLETLKDLLSDSFDFVACCDLPFLIREHARKFQWSVAQGSIWTRRD